MIVLKRKAAFSIYQKGRRNATTPATNHRLTFAFRKEKVIAMYARRVALKLF
jgi:hypothetical protein